MSALIFEKVLLQTCPHPNVVVVQLLTMNATHQLDNCTKIGLLSRPQYSYLWHLHSMKYDLILLNQ